MVRSISDEDGANAVEFALLLPVLVLLLFGTMYGASLFNTQQTLTQAAREGARFGSILPLAEVVDGGVEPPPAPAWYAEVAQRARSVVDVDRPLTPGTVTVCVGFYDAGGAYFPNPANPANCPGPSPSSGLQGARVEVTVTRPATLELGIASIGPIELRASALGRYEPSTEAP